MKRNKKGFTLVELVIVIAVIAILSVVLIPQLTNVIGDAKEAKAKSACSTAVNNYVIEKGATAPVDGTIFASNGYYFVFNSSTENDDQLSKVEIANYTITPDGDHYIDNTTPTAKTFDLVELENAVNGVVIYVPRV